MPEEASKAGSKKPDEPKGNGDSHWGTWIVILAVFILGVGAMSLLREKKPKPPTPPPVSITTTNVARGSIDVAVESLGSVTPVYTANLSPRVDGQVMEVNYAEGQMVKSNDLLVVIDPGPYQAALTQAQGQFQRDTNVLEEARIDLRRYQAAFAKNAVPQQQVFDQMALVHQDEGTVKVDQGLVDNAQVQLNYCYIRAPFAGRVGLRLVDPGNVVHGANTNAVVVVAQLQPITVIFNVAEDYLPQIQEAMHAALKASDPPGLNTDSPETPQSPPPVGREMTVEAWDRADEKILATGKVLALNNMIDTATGTIRIRAQFDNTSLALYPNQFVNARLIIKTLHNLCLVPTYAVQHNADGTFVYVVTNSPGTNSTATNSQSVTMRQIVTGTADANVTAVLKGLEPGDVIALDNFNKLGEGAAVRLRQPENEAQADGKSQHKGGGQGHKKPEEDKDSS